MDFQLTAMQAIWPLQRSGHHLTLNTLIDCTIICENVRVVRADVDEDTIVMYFGDARGMPLPLETISTRFIVEAPATAEICQPFAGLQLSASQPMFFLYALDPDEDYCVRTKVKPARGRGGQDTEEPQVLWRSGTQHEQLCADSVIDDTSSQDPTLAFIFERMQAQLDTGISRFATAQNLSLDEARQRLKFDPEPGYTSSSTAFGPEASDLFIPFNDGTMGRKVIHEHRRPQIVSATGDTRYNRHINAASRDDNGEDDHVDEGSTTGDRDLLPFIWT
ncbi:hypothetical protein BD626DRAFT_479301 [Schizophyllum amplum]|uniref:Uncharacterized protein n=1 Tax=Schizophyllum amplum TaxID=97359 RepID=A0A550CS53_9AGAR|nr:hypothetical protein BD626DRAFT_479301 [Auriculariopsis ampla]